MIVNQIVTSIFNFAQKQLRPDQPYLNTSLLEEFHIHAPSKDSQIEIIRRVDQFFACADTIEKQVNSLTLSILAKAFRGELTEQWRKDKPELISGNNSAEALLGRIKAERAAITPAKKTRKKVSS